MADAVWRAQWAEQREFHAMMRQRAESGARCEEQRRQIAIDEVRAHAKEQNQIAATDAAGSDAAAMRVRDAADRLAATPSNCPGDSGVARRGEAAARAAMVLSDMFKRADARAGELAKAYDRARIAGLACEFAYQSVRIE
nr:DUF2514 family protein [Pseudomonas fluorescens]